MSFTLRKAVLEDVAGICKVYFSAFEDSLLSSQCFPASSGPVRESWVDDVVRGIEDKQADYLVVDAEAPKGPEVIGFAKWNKPGRPLEMPPPKEVWPQDGNPALAAEFFGALAKGHEKYMGDKKHWHLEIIAVKRDWAGKGVSRPLVKWGVEKADESGLPCFLESAESAVPVYERNGFKHLEELKIETPKGLIKQYFMLREPAAK